MPPDTSRKLDGYSRRAECLQAIATEYNNFDRRHLWKACRLPDGADCHDMMLLGKIKLRPDGTEEKVRFRAVLRGQGFERGRHCGTNTFSPCPQLTTARCMIHDSLVNDKELK